MKYKKKLPRWVWIPAGVIFLFLFLFYGPFKSFRYMWINTAMYSSRHQFLARIFYTENYINKVLAQNELTGRRTDDLALANNWDDEVEIAGIRGNHYRGFIIKINDPRRLIFSQADSEGGHLLEYLIDKHSGIGGINATGYAYPRRRGIPWGITIVDGQVVSNITREEPYTMGGFTADFKLVVGNFTEEEIMAQQYVWAFEFGPILIVNGEKTEISPFYGGLAPRTAIGQTEEGHILLVAIDGRQLNSIGATFQDLQTILHANGAVNAINLDGGSSTTIVYQGILVNNPADGDAERLLPNAIIFK